jgi:alginate O-acetyltransferase complex protein AlgI
VVIADRLAEYVNMVYNNVDQYSGFQNLLATFFFSFQIYCDFSGYSDIAIGAAMIMGYSLMTNFRRPYLSLNIREFWQRWHISLSTWFRDYVYISIGGNKVIKWRWYFNLFITFLISGLWHGANWTFVIWGALHGFYLIFAIWTYQHREAISRALGVYNRPRLYKLIQILVTFVLVYFSWIFFRANSLADAWLIIRNSFVFDSETTVNLFTFRIDMLISLVSIAVLLIIESLEEYKGLSSYLINRTSRLTKWIILLLILLLIIILGVWKEADFLYFQF